MTQLPKFRAYHPKRNEMYEVWGLTKEFIFKDSLDSVGTPDSVDEVVLMQYPGGLTDRFSVEVCQGDLIKCHKDFGSPVAEVVYIHGHGCWGLVHDSFKRTVTQYKRLTQKTLNESLGEIVGNAHQHKHLLK